MRPTRLAVVVSHPIQHFCPQYANWSRLPSLELRVFFASQHGLKAYRDADFGQIVRWKSLSLEFPHEFLAGAETRALGTRIDAPSLADRLSEFDPDAILLHGYSQPLQRRALAWAKDRKLPLLMIGDSELRSRRHALKRLAKSWVLPRVFAGIDRFLTVGDANEAYYRHYGVTDDRMVRCCFPIDTTLYDRALAARTEARDRIRSQHGVPPDHVVLLMVGKLVPWKRQADLVQLSNQLQRSHSGVTVVLSGSGPDEAKLRSLAVRTGAGGVIFAGFVPETTLPDYYSAADVYVHCSEREAHSLAISEATYCGLPVVLSSSCGSHGPADEVRTGLNGYVYQTGRIAELEARLIPLIGSPDRRAAMGKASSEIARLNQRLAHGTGILQALDSIGL